jgi:hypothetical protein
MPSVSRKANWSAGCAQAAIARTIGNAAILADECIYYL